MPELWGRDGGVNRKLWELYETDGGVNRKLKELWGMKDGVNRKIFSARAQLAGTPDIGYSGSKDIHVTKNYSISSFGIDVNIGFIIFPSSDSIQGSITIPLDLQQSETFSCRNGTVLRADESLHARALSGNDGHNNLVSNPPSKWHVQIGTSFGYDGEYSQLLSGNAPDYTISAGQKVDWGSVADLTTSFIYLCIWFGEDVSGWVNVNYQGYYGLNFFIPNEALTIIGGSGNEYPVSFS